MTPNAGKWAIEYLIKNANPNKYPKKNDENLEDNQQNPINKKANKGINIKYLIFLLEKRIK